MLVIEALRAATRCSHQLLEQHLVINRPGATRSQLVRYLADLRGWLLPINDNVWGRPWPTRLRAERRLAKTRWLERDLAALGTPPESPPETPPEHARALHPTHPSDDGAWLLGAAYVIEGSMLGGRVLGRRFATQCETPLRFFEGYGAETGAMWTTLVAELERAGRRPTERARMIEGAVASFADVHAWMRSRGSVVA